MSKKPYTAESVERALVHHSTREGGAVRTYSPPYTGHPKWRVILRNVPNETMELNLRETWALCQGLAAGVSSQRLSEVDR